MAELKELQDQMLSSFEQLKAIGTRQENEIKQFGAVTEETKTIIGRINTEMDELKGRLDTMETKSNRSPFGADGKPIDPKTEAKNEALFKFMREGLGGMSKEEKALVQDTTGEIIVPYDLDQQIYRELPKFTVMRRLASVRQTNSNRVRRRSMNEVTVGWGKLETSATKTLTGTFESTLVPADAYIYVEDAYGLTKIGEDELEDTDVNLTDYLAMSFNDAYGALEDTGFMKGTGHANEQPEGLLNGTTVTRFDTGTVATFVPDDLIKLYYAVPAQYRKNGTYIVHSLIEQTLRLAKDTQGQYLWQPALTAGSPNMFNGKPIEVQDDLQGTVATGNLLAVFGDIKLGYQVVDRKQSVITRLNELYAEDGLIGFRYKRRTGGGIVRPNAMRILKVK